jgi:hypothetical protein
VDIAYINHMAAIQWPHKGERKMRVPASAKVQTQEQKDENLARFTAQLEAAGVAAKEKMAAFNARVLAHLKNAQKQSLKQKTTAP